MRDLGPLLLIWEGILPGAGWSRAGSGRGERNRKRREGGSRGKKRGRRRGGGAVAEEQELEGDGEEKAPRWHGAPAPPGAA